MGEEEKKDEEAGEKAPVRYGEDEFGTYRIDDKIWTMNQIRDHPMFMEDVPQDIEDNPELLALQSLLYDNHTDEEMAEHFKNLGNEAFRNSTNKIASRNALMAYTKGLEMECKDNKLNAVLHSNRAAVSIRLKENDKAVDDCRKAVKLDPTNVKAFYRGAKSSEALGLTSQALKFCKGALELKPDDKEVIQMKKRMEKQLAEEEKQHKSRNQAIEKENRNRSVASEAVKGVLDQRGVKVGPILFNVAMYFQGAQPEPQLTEDAPDAVQWPLLMLYDEIGQSDFVEVFDERCALEDQLQVMFPTDRRVDWDEDGKYVWDRLVAYLEYHAEEGSDTRMKKISTAEPFGETFRGLTVPKCMVVHILVAGSGALHSFCREHHLPPP